MKPPKLSRDATPQEIFPTGKHGPISDPRTEAVIRDVMRTFKKLWPDLAITVFVGPYEAGGRLNYASTAQRADMIPTIRACLDLLARDLPKLDRINDVPPTGAKQ